MFVTLTEDGTIAQWIISDGRCIAYWENSLSGIAPPWNITVFKDGQFMAINGNGPELVVMNLWNKNQQQLMHTRRDWVMSTAAFKEVLYAKLAGGGADPHSFTSLSTSVSNPEKSGPSKMHLKRKEQSEGATEDKNKLAFLSLSAEDRLYVWEYVGKSG